MYFEVKRVKRKESLVLDNEDEKIIRLFTDLGMPRNLSKTLMYLCQVNECRSGDVERGADLRQPDREATAGDRRPGGRV